MRNWILCWMHCSAANIGHLMTVPPLCHTDIGKPEQVTTTWLPPMQQHNTPITPGPHISGCQMTVGWL
jgi:hypothetical protein